jgi:hypothetical protein
LTLSLLVLQRTIEKDNPGVGDLSPHLGMRNILVDHDSLQDFTVLNLPSWNLFDSSISLQVDCLDVEV